jgi:hypothetical protein
MTATAQYVALLAVSVGLTFLVGRLLVTAGGPFLREVFRDRAVIRSVNLLLSVLFHLITLGVLAIVSVVGWDATAAPVQTFVARLGIVLLILGVAYGTSILVLIRLRERRRDDRLSDHVQERPADDRGLRSGPVPGQTPPVTIPAAAARPVPSPP